MPDSDIILEGKNLNKSYVDKGKKLQALKDVSFFLKNGEILGIVGESGSGKSTLLRHVSCLEKPDSGNLYYKGTEYTGKSPAFAGTFLQMIFQDAQMSFDPRMKMKKAVVEATKGCGHEKLSRILEAVGLDESLLEKKAGSMSGGQCQRMSIARVVTPSPEWMVPMLRVISPESSSEQAAPIFRPRVSPQSFFAKKYSALPSDSMPRPSRARSSSEAALMPFSGHMA